MKVLSKERISKSFWDKQISVSLFELTFFSNQNKNFNIAKLSFRWAFLNPLNSTGFFIAATTGAGYDPRDKTKSPDVATKNDVVALNLRPEYNRLDLSDNNSIIRKHALAYLKKRGPFGAIIGAAVL